METAYDWVTIGIFAGLVVLFLERSTSDKDHVDDPLWMYLAGGAGCGFTNYLGNNHLHIPAILVLVATIGFIVYFLKPYPSSNSR